MGANVKQSFEDQSLAMETKFLTVFTYKFNALIALFENLVFFKNNEFSLRFITTIIESIVSFS
jgi:hypothetical protein